MSIFNEPIDPILVRQLKKKQDLMGKEKRNSIELTFLNSNTSWVKLQSSVNLNDSAEAAKKNILFGGSTQVTEKNALVVAAGLSTGDINKDITGFSYNLKTSEDEQNVLGLKPMPGITSVTIENIGAYGSTRKATVNFQCWDVKQLEILEALYMRPGYTVLLEFGRGVYLDTDSTKLVEVFPRVDFFRDDVSDLHKYLSNLYRESLKQYGNYDAFFGYVVNFKWAAQAGGGYNCMTEILSTGEVVESLKLNYSYGGAIKYDSLGSTAETAKNAYFQGLILKQGAKGIAGSDILRFNNEYSENILSGLIYELYTTCRYENTGSLYSRSSNPSGSSQIKIVSPSNKTIAVDWARINYESTADEPISTDTKDNTRFLNNWSNYYVTLGSFCELVSEFIIPRAYDRDNLKSKGSLTGISTKNKTYTKGDKIGTYPSEDLLCLYNSLVISTNPDVCWVQNSKWTSIISNTGVTVDTTPAPPVIYSNPYVKEAWSLDLRNRIQGWLNDMFDKDVDNTVIQKNIDDTYKLFKTRSSLLLLEKDFYKALQANFQLIRGGIANGKRNWDGFTSGTAKAKNALLVPDISRTNSFYSLYRYHYPSTWLTPNTSIENKLSSYSGDSAVDPKLDREIQKLAGQVAEVKNAAATSAATSDNLKTISGNFKKLAFYKEFKYDKKKNGGTSLSDFGVIGNIYVNLKHLYLLSKSQTLLSSDPSGKNIISLGRYFDSLIHDIQTSLGNVNDFKIHIDPIDGIARIIDLNYINKDQAKEIFEFNIGNSNSIIRDLKLESYMSNDMMNMLSISAQASPGKMGYDNTTITTYNQGITDRNIPTKDIPLRFNSDGTAAVNFISNLGLLVNIYLKKLFEVDGTVFKDRNTEEISSTTTHPMYDASKSNTYSNALREIINFISSSPDYTSDNAGKSLLATEISLTLDGLSGFIIGNLFKVDNTFIPKYYKNSYQDMGYTITGVSHDISNSDWNTTIKAFPVDLGSNTIPTTDPTKFSTIYIDGGNPGGGGSSTSGGGGSDSKPGVTTNKCGDATVDVRPLLTRFGITLGTIAPGNDTLVTPQWYETLEQYIFPFIKKYAKSPKVTSVHRPNNVGSLHQYGNAIDVQISGINAASLLPNYKNTRFSGWNDFKASRVAKRSTPIDISGPNRSHPYTRDQITAIREFEDAFVGAFAAKPTGGGFGYFDFNINGNAFRVLNENTTPSPLAEGPHFHFMRLCDSTDNKNKTPKTPNNNKTSGNKNTPPQPKTSTPVPPSSVTPPGTTPLITTTSSTSTNQTTTTQNLTTALQSAVTLPPNAAPAVISVPLPRNPLNQSSLPTPPTPSPTPLTPSQQPLPKPSSTPPVPSPTILPAPSAKSTWKFPYVVQIPYTADGSRTNIVDEMHAFQSTQGKVVGNGNIIVGDVLKKMYRDGIKPIVTGVSVTTQHRQNSAGLHWYITIEESKDGLAYTGFTSRGSGSSAGLPSASQARSDGKDEMSIKNNINKQLGYMPKVFKQVGPDITESDNTYKRYFRQVFYVYTDQNPEGIKSE
jgi:hypothetical protein